MNMEIECKLCLKKFKNYNSLAKHIHFSHKDFTKKQYYDNYIGETSPICICGKEKKFRNIAKGYLKYCSLNCFSLNTEPTKYWEGKTQPKEMIIKRIENTDQIEKQKKREKTLIERYGNKKYNNSKKIGESSKGKKSPRTKEHQIKIIQSKINNNTIKHTLETKLKIANSLKKLYQSDNAPVSVSKNPNGKNYETGILEGISFRSSYEKKFIQYCLDNNINISSAENKYFRVKYSNIDNENHFYYPDFYLHDFNCIIEIKPLSKLIMENEQIKLHEGMLEHNLILVTEEELSDLESFFQYL